MPWQWLFTCLTYMLTRKWKEATNVDFYLFSHIWKKAKCHYRPSPFHITLCKCRHPYYENIFLSLYSPCRDLDNSKIHFTQGGFFYLLDNIWKKFVATLTVHEKKFCHKVYLNIYLNKNNNEWLWLQFQLPRQLPWDLKKLSAVLFSSGKFLLLWSIYFTSLLNSDFL